MDSRETKRTVPVPSVGADGEQPISQTPTASITEETTENNPPEKNYAELLRKMQRMNDPAYLPTISMNELYENVYQSRPPVIDGLLYPGTYLFAGAPKVGKSFLMAQLAYHVSMGLPLWDYPVHKGTVLYLALEDDHRRLQERLYRMFGMDGTNDLLFSICAKQVGNGLEEQLKRFVQEHPDTKLIIIDTLQKIREAGGDKYSYANDYEVVGKLKRLADACGVCLLLVHHTRKQQADDKFDIYCDPRQSQQKGACEKNHVEIRKLLPKGAGVRFDRLTAADCALLMSQVNSEPRGALGFLTPARVLRMALGEDASALMDAFGVEELAPGGLDLTPGCIDRARAARGEGPLAG